MLVVDGAAFDDGAYIVYVNGEKRTEHTPLGRLMHDFFCRDAKDMYNKKLAARVSYLKDDQGGVKVMCELMQKLFDKEKVEVAERMLKKGYEVDEIADVLQISSDDVRRISDKINAQPVA